MIIAYPNAADIVNGSATATGTLCTVPAGRWLNADICLSAVQSGVGTAAPSVTFTATGTGFAPASGSTVARLEVGGLLGIISSDSNTISIVVYGGSNGATVTFNASGTTSSAVLNGFYV